jgi:hypothetical protein
MNSFSRLSLVGLVLCTSQIAGAAQTVRDMVVHTSKTMLDVKLDATTVSCAGGELKVAVPKLGALTLMNHDDFSVGATALSAGPCAPGRMPIDIINAADPVDGVEIVVKAVRQDHVDTMAQDCTTYLVERAEATIRGVAFSSEGSSWLGYREVNQCNGGDSPADAPGQVEAPAESGCTASRGGTTSFALLLALGLVLRRRRYR